MEHYPDPKPFLDAVRVDHGPRLELGEYFLRTALQFQQLGIDLYISRDPYRLDRLGPDYDAARPARFPPFDAGLAGFGETHWFTVEGRFGRGRPAFVTVCRLIETATSLADELTSFRLFYATPETQRLATDVVDITAPSPALIAGRIGLQGAYWVNPALRGQGLARRFPALGRWYALTLWGIDHAVGFLHRDDADRGLAQKYGEPEPERWITFSGRWQDQSCFTHQTRAMMEAHILREDSASGVVTRANETLDTNLSPDDVRHGKIKRS